jgi:hypothetical protein
LQRIGPGSSCIDRLVVGPGRPLNFGRYVALEDDMKVISYLLLMNVVVLLPVPPHAKGSVHSRDEVEFTVLINPDGWQLIGLRGSRVEVRKALPSNEALSKSTIFHSVLRPKERTILLDQRAHYYPKKDGSLLVQRVAIQTNLIQRYDVEGRPFCYVYLGPGVRIMVRENERLLIPVGCSGGVAFYDENGDGKFERQDVLGGTAGFQPRIPQWVKEYISSAPQHNTRLERTRR